MLFRSLERLADVRWVPLLLGVIVIGVATAATRVSPRIPAPLLGVVLAVAVARLLGVREAEVGNLQTSLPAFAGFSWTAQDVYTVLPSAFALRSYPA